jgi:uroporphyrinogen-III decarboxylase
MTGRERLLAAFHGEQPDYVPFAPNLYYWSYSHRARGSLPEEIASAEHPFDVLRWLGADILARWDTQYATREVFTAGESTDEFSGQSRFDRPVVTAFNIYPPGTSIRRRSFTTPYGTLSQTWALTEESGADFESEYWWKDWSEYKAVRYFLEARDYVFDAAEFHSWVERVGDDGLVMASVTYSPLKNFHWLAGAANASLFIADHPAEMKELAKIHERKALALIEQMVDLPEVEVLISNDNLDSAFHPPYLYREFCDSFYTKAAEIIHGRGKIFLVHGCGRNKALLPLVGRSRIGCLEGLTPPPNGDVLLAEARRLAGYENFTVNGGMDATRLEIREEAEARLHAYTRDLFAAMGDKRHFIYASSCTTPAGAPWENLKYLRDAARRYGRLE